MTFTIADIAVLIIIAIIVHYVFNFVISIFLMAKYEDRIDEIIFAVIKKNEQVFLKAVLMQVKDVELKVRDNVKKDNE